MDQPSGMRRREFLRRAAIGAGAIGAIAAAPRLLGASAADDEAESTAAILGAPSQSMVAYVRDAGAGEVVLMAGTTEVVVRDRVLASRLARGLAGSAGI